MRGTKERKCQVLKTVMTVLVMCVMFVCISVTALAAEGKVTASPAAKIRESASTTSEQVGSAQTGAVLEILNEVTGTDGKIWYQVSFDNGKTGYIRSDLMKKLEDTTTTPSNTATEVKDVQPVNCTVTGNQVNVRSIPATSGDKVAQVRKDEVMTVNGTATDSEGKIWYRVTFTSDNKNVTGYVRYDFVSLSGELKPVEEVVTPPEVDVPVDTPPVQDEPVTVPTLSKDYDTVLDEGVWYLIDNVNDPAKRYNLENVMDAAIKNPKIYDEIESKVNKQKGWITFLVILVILMMVAITLLVLKIKDVMDEAYFSAVEKETIRQRQEKRQNAGSRPGTAQRQGAPRQGSATGTQNRNVMHTVGANGSNGQKPGTVVKQGVPKMNITKPGEGTPQTVKVSNPADTRASKPVIEKAGQSAETSKAVVTEDTKIMKPIESTVAKRAVNTAKQTWQSKNFMTDDDDDMEYGFLDWEEGEE